MKPKAETAVAQLAAVYGITENELVSRFIAIMKLFGTHRLRRRA